MSLAGEALPVEDSQSSPFQTASTPRANSAWPFLISDGESVWRAGSADSARRNESDFENRLPVRHRAWLRDSGYKGFGKKNNGCSYIRSPLLKIFASLAIVAPSQGCI